jgi:hypothetical protein
MTEAPTVPAKITVVVTGQVGDHQVVEIARGVVDADIPLSLVPDEDVVHVYQDGREMGPAVAAYLRAVADQIEVEPSGKGQS